MSWNSEKEELGTQAMLPWNGRPSASAESANSIEEQKGFLRLMQCFWQAIKGYTATDIDRIKEAGVQKIEAQARKDHAEADAKIAAAARDHAEAEKLRAEADAIRCKAKNDQLITQAEAIERFSNAVSNIRRKGGDVGFSQKELIEYILLGAKKFPKDEGLSRDAKAIQDGD